MASPVPVPNATNQAIAAPVTTNTSVGGKYISKISKSRKQRK